MKLFQIMPCRYSSLQSTIEGFDISGVPLISFNDACNLGQNAGLGPAGYAENIGSWYIIPKIVNVFGVSLEASVQLFYSGSVLASIILGIIGCWLYCKTIAGKLTSVLAVGFLGLIIAGIGDYYVLSGATTFALIPWWLLIQKHYTVKVQLIFLGVAGIILAISHWTRSHAGTGVFLFIVLALVLSKKYNAKTKLASFLILFTGMFLVSIFFSNLVTQRNIYLTNNKTTHDLTVQRAFWHNLYYSLGYLHNYYGWEPSDSHSVRAALSIDPDVLVHSNPYELILKKEFFKIVKHHPFFVLQTLFAKLGVLLMYVLMFANIGLVLAKFYPQGYQFNLLFAAGIGFNMLFGLLATPDYQYLMGLFAFATLYGVYSIDYAVDQGLFQHLRKIKRA